MTEPETDRRSFLRRFGLVALAAPTLPWVGCVPEPADDPERRARRSARIAPLERGLPITRPILLPWDGEGVRIESPPAELPVAYVSMAERRVFIEHAYRDQVFWDLRAYISVSTGLWRLPLVGDVPEQPIMPGDALREFEEMSMRDWDPTAPPADGDIRILRGRAVARAVDFECVPLAGGTTWIAAGPWDIPQCGVPAETLCREDFFAVGEGTRYADRECTQRLGSVRLFTWACREPTESGA